MMSSAVYLDNNATTQVDPRVVEAMLPYFTEHYANAASTSHAMGLDASDAVETAREQVADCLNANLREIVFTSGATEANNIAIKGLLRASPGRAHVVVSAAEHRAVLDPIDRMRREGVMVSVVPVDRSGCVSVKDVERELRPNTAMVSIMFANNEVGSINPVHEIGRLCRERDVLFHCDAVQAFGKVRVDTKAMNVDLLSISAHKLYGPKGVGALYIREVSPAIRIEPLFNGGGHENQLRSGTLPVPLIVGFGKAATLAIESMEDESEKYRVMQDRLWSRLVDQIPGVKLNGQEDGGLANTLNFSLPGVDGEELLANIEGIAISSGSACTSSEPEPSHVLRAMGVSSELAKASVRVSFGRFNTSDDVDVAVRQIVSVHQFVRSN